MTRPPHEVILASAGTGKTFQLARRYVRLLAGGTDHGTILATTFTRKAAREILARVLQWLARGAADDASFRALSSDVWGEDPWPEDWSQERCRELLSEVVHGLHRFQVRTLDAWFASLARLFGLELGLPPNWSVADDRDDTRMRDAVLAALFEADAEMMSRTVAALQGGDSVRRVHSAQQELLGDGLELLRDSRPEAWQTLARGDAPDIDPMGLYAALDESLIPLTGKGTKNQAWDKSFIALREALTAQDAWAVLDVGVVKKVLGGEQKFSRVEIEDPVLGILRQALEWAGHHILGDLHARTQAARTLLEAFGERYEQAKRREGGFRHEDVPRLLVEAAERLDPVSVAYRSGARIRHLMLDEFQDTSVWQWRVLEPLLERIVQPDAEPEAGQPPPSLFCVGDVKQSIYAWRQGEPRLLAMLSEWYKLDEPSELAVSYRSSQAVLDLVNAVFGPLGERWGAIPGLQEDTAEDWAKGWREHRAHFQDLAGSARARLVAKDAEGQVAMVEEVAREVQQIRKTRPEASIGILLRRRKHMPALLRALEDLQIQASGEGGSELTDAQAVQAVLSAFRLADAPTDTLAAYHLANGPLAAVAGLDTKRAGLPKEHRRPPFESDAAEASARLRARLLALGTGGFVESLRDPVRRQWGEDPWEMRRYAQLVDLAHAFDGGSVRRPGDFVAHVEGTTRENPAPSTVRVMTIHGSKGLEFDAVVLPLWEERGGGRDTFLYSRPQPRDPCAAVVTRPSQSLAALDPGLEKLFAETTRRTQTEALCVLYVALTRAKSRLEVLIAQGPESPNSFSLPLVVQSMLNVSEDSSWAVVHGPEVQEGAATDSTGPAEEVEHAVLSLKAASGTRGRPRWAPSGAEAEQVVDGRKLFLRGGDAARTRGTAIHRLFQEVEWMDQPAAFDATDSELCALLVQEGVGDGSTHVEALRSFRKSLMRTEVKQLLMRAAYQEQGGHEPWVWRERRFAVRLPEPGDDENPRDAILHGEFDRVVVERDAEGKALRAHIVDFKTGRVRDDAELERKREAYRPQMLAYRRAVCALTGLAPEDVRLSLLFVDAGRVAHLD